MYERNEIGHCTPPRMHTGSLISLQGFWYVLVNAVIGKVKTICGGG